MIEHEPGGGFSPPPPEQEESHEKKSSLFQKLARSKLAKAIAFAAAVGAVPALYKEILDERQQKESEAWSESSKRTIEDIRSREAGEHPAPAFDFEELNDEFESAVVIPGKRSVIHIEQTHRGNKVEERYVTEEETVERQKKIETLLLWLAEHEQTDTVFDELTVPEYVNFLQTVDKEALQSAYPAARQENIMAIGEGASKDVEQTPEFMRALVAYKSSVLLDREIIRIEAALQARESGNVTDAEAERYISITELQGGPFTGGTPEDELQYLRAHRDELRNNDLIAGDKIYYWGAAMKLYIEGKINLMPAETMETNARGMAPAKVDLDAIGVSEDEMKTPEGREKIDQAIRMSKEQRNDIRDSTAVAIIGQSHFEHYAPLVFGAGHSFKNNIEEYNQQHPDAPLGLIRVWSEEEPAENK